MATQLKEDFTEATRWRRRPRPTFAWVAQVVSGVLLLVLLTVHMVAQHFVVEGGLRGRTERIVAQVLLGVAVVTIMYGLWLLYRIAFGG